MAATFINIPRSLAGLTGLTLLALAPLFVVASALADEKHNHEEATGVVKERMDLMETQKEAMKVIGAMAKGQVPFDAAEAATAAKEIETTAAKIPELFPEGTDGPPSEAKPEIWTDWDRFVGDAENLTTAAQALVAAFESAAPEWKAEFKGVIDACKSCHKVFREEEEE